MLETCKELELCQSWSYSASPLFRLFWFLGGRGKCHPPALALLYKIYIIYYIKTYAVENVLLYNHKVWMRNLRCGWLSWSTWQFLSFKDLTRLYKRLFPPRLLHVSSAAAPHICLLECFSQSDSSGPLRPRPSKTYHLGRRISSPLRPQTNGSVTLLSGHWLHFSSHPSQHQQALYSTVVSSAPPFCSPHFLFDLCHPLLFDRLYLTNEIYF